MKKMLFVEEFYLLLFFFSILPLHEVSIPLQFPSASQRQTFDPFKRNPSSQLNVTLFGKVVSRPAIEPFNGAVRGPQSLAVGEQRM